MLFNWFKNKQNNLLPTDINDSMMTSYISKKGIKLNTILSIPTGMVCFLSYKDKLYETFESGKHELTKDILSKLYLKQSKKNKNLKKLQFDLHYINQKRFTNIFSYKQKLLLDSIKTKINFSITISAQVLNNQAFYNFVLSHYPYTDSLKTTVLLEDYIIEFSKYNFKKTILEELSLPNTELMTYKDKLQKHLLKIGITLNNVDVQLSTKNNINKNETISQKTDFFGDFASSIQSNKQQLDTNNHSDTALSTNSNTYNTVPTLSNDVSSTNYKAPQPLINCPVCQIKTIEGSRYCHRCGWEIR